jgi:transposase
LLISRDFQIPLLHHLYAGNIPDVSLFPQLRSELMGRYQAVTGKLPQATVVMDKGNVSDDVMEQLVDGGVHFVVAVTANRFKSLLATRGDQFQSIDSMPGTQTFETTEELWGRTCRLVVVYTESLFTQQLQGVTHNLVKCQKKLLDLGKSLQRWREGKNRRKKPTVAGVRKSLKRILSAQFMKDLIPAEVKQDDKTGIPILAYHVDHVALQSLSENRLGRTLLVSDRTDWNARQIAETYRSLSRVEDAFKSMKNTDFLRWQPAYHWTDQKLCVHALYCVLALLISSLARQIVFAAGIELTLPALLSELSKIREVAVIYPQGTLAHRKDHLTLSRMSSRQKKLAQALDIAHILAQ